MKKIRFIIFLGLFVAALYLGYHIGFNSPAPVMPAEAKNPDSKAVTKQVVVMPNGQISLLLVMVNDLQSARPRLESVWLVEFVPPDPRLTLLSVYPSFNAEEAKHDDSLVSAFRIESSDSGLQIGQTFLNVLRERKLFWSGSLLLDEYALVQTLDYLNRPRPEESLGDQPAQQPAANTVELDKAASLPSSSQNPQMALFGQAAIYQALCQSASQRNPVLDKAGQEELGKLLEGHLYPDLDPQRLAPRLKAYQSSGAAFFCVFPTLPIQSMSSR